MGIQILNKDVSLISSIAGIPKASIGSVGGKTGWVGGVAPFLITPPGLSTYSPCANPYNPPTTVINMVWGGTPAPTITYDWIDSNEASSIGQYTDALVLQYDMFDMTIYCLITATNSAGVTQTQTAELTSLDCS
jgi:hypothetical protein